MGDETKKRAISKKTMYIALGVVLALVAAGAAWAVLGDEAAEIAGVGESTSTADATGSVDAQSDDATLTASEATRTLASEPEGGDLEIDYEAGAILPVVDQMTGAIVGVTGSGGSYVLSIDFVEFLAGEEAVAAAKEHGDTASDSGLYIVNDNPKVRDYPIQPDITVRVTTNVATPRRAASSTVIPPRSTPNARTPGRTACSPGFSRVSRRRSAARRLRSSISHGM